MKRWFGRFAIGLAGLASMIAAANARITHIEITKSEPAFGGQSFGDTGAYERLTGRVTGELDPADPANSGIQDINLAPRNERGMVEYVTNIELLKPADMARGQSNPVLRSQQPRQQACARLLQCRRCRRRR